MFPHEAQAIMAKLLFFVFAIILVCMVRVRADEICYSPVISVEKITDL